MSLCSRRQEKYSSRLFCSSSLCFLFSIIFPTPGRGTDKNDLVIFEQRLAKIFDTKHQYILFFYMNKFYKNTGPEMCEALRIFKNKPGTEILKII